MILTVDQSADVRRILASDCHLVAKTCNLYISTSVAQNKNKSFTAIKTGLSYQAVAHFPM